MAASRRPSIGRPSPRRGATGCDVSELFAMLGQPHMLGLLHLLQESGAQPLRFGEIGARLSIPPKTLSKRLRRLVDAGFVLRRSYNEIPPRVEYEPTVKTSDLEALFSDLRRWSQRHTLTAVRTVSVTGPVRR
jgi:DNA-binding HxlR family transcriptional regulator